MKQFVCGLAILGFLFLFNSCIEDDFGPFDEVESAFGIRHDRPLSDYESLAMTSGSDLPNFSAVISFNYSLDGSDNDEYVASGTLIAPDWVITAAHNFYDAQEQNSPAPPNGIKVNIGNDPNNPDQRVSVSEIFIHPTWLNGNQEFADANDICLVKLQGKVDGVAPVLPYFESSEPIDREVYFCGFGDYSLQPGQDRDLLSRKHAVENILDRKIDGLISSLGGKDYNGGLLAFDFDDPEGIINSLGDDEVNEDESILGAGTSTPGALDYEGTTVQGDSGGPLFVKLGSTWYVAGVLGGGASEPINNHRDGDYGDISIFTRVSSHASWIQSIIK